MGARVRSAIATAMALACAWLAASGCRSPAEECRYQKEERDRRDRGACLEACEAGDAHGCGLAASAMYLGEGGPKDYDGALRVSRRACELDPGECRSQGFYECKADPKLCAERCLSKDAESCAWQARGHLSTDERAGYDQEKALAFYRRACELNPYHCGEGLGMACGQSPNSCLVACEDGNAAKCYWTAVLFRHGKDSILRDRERAQRYLEQACRLDPKLDGLAEVCAGLEPAPLPAERPVVPVTP